MAGKASERIVIALDKILVPTDFSDNSRQALQYARALAERFGSEVHLLHVLQDLTGFSPEAGLLFASSGDFAAELRESAERALQKISDSDSEQSNHTIRQIREGQPFLEIIRYAKENSINLIVIGTHGRSGLAHVLLGSVAEKVVRKASCPVLTVRASGLQFEMP